MSTDYDVWCARCRLSRHLGQRFTTGWAFGYGRNDTEGRLGAGEFILKHEPEGHLRISNTEDVPDDVRDDPFDTFGLTSG